MLHICRNCNEEFKGRNDKRVNFCSKDCCVEFRSKQLEKRKATCLNCKIDFYKPKLGSPNKFCSSSCSAKYNNVFKIKHGNFSKNKECLLCTKVIPDTGKYCSKLCQKVYQATLRNKEIAETGFVTSPVKAKKYLIDIFGHECSICKIKEWMGQKVPIILDHIDGHSENNSLNNLRLVCPNCDAQLPTFKSKNKGNGRHSRRIRYAEGKSF